MLKRAYSVLDIKSIDVEQRLITGIATSASVDRQGDIVEPSGATFKLPLPLLWQHDSDQPIGHVTSAKATKDGIAITAQIAKIDTPGPLKDRLDMAWQSIAAKLVRGLSIGFMALEEAYDKSTGGFHFLKWEWLELSAVTIPANQDASIQTIKSLDVGLAATGTQADRHTRNRPGASGTSRVVSTQQGRTMPKKTIADQIKEFENKRAANVARQEEIQGKAVDEGRSKDESEQDEFNTLDAEIDSIDKELVDLRKMEARKVQQAKRVVVDTPEDASRSRDTSSVIVMPRKEAPGIRFARMAMCIAAAKGSMSDAVAYAKQFYSGDEALQACIKTAVAGGTTANNQAPLLQYTDLLSEFVDYLRPLTVLGKFGGPIPGAQGNYPQLTRVPFNVRVGTQTAGASGSWVGEGKPTPLSKGTFGTATLDFFKLAAICVLTKEEVRFAAISAETKVRNDLANALVAKADLDFTDPSNTGTAGSKPASITNNVAATAASATTAVGFAVDLKTIINLMLASNIQVGSLVLIMPQQIALALSLMRTSLGIRNYPDITLNGGYVEGIPVITSEALTSLGSPSTPSIIAVNARDVFLADDGVVNIEASDQASLEMSDGPAQDGTTGSGASMVSLWQTGMLGIKATREINWKLMRSASCQYISGGAYTPQ